ncbi:31089_t:CDS:1, partial [Gigaspora margarita]
LETYNERLQATDIPYLNESLEVKKNSNNKNTEESGSLYPVVQGIDFKNWKKLN